jgi:hypothetical protein
VFDIGGSLAAARKGQGLTPSDAERLTCLRVKYITALERDDFDALPGRTYARAFLRTYADVLGLDANRYVAEFDERFPEPEELEELAPIVRVRRRSRVRPRRVVALAVVAAIVGVAIWGALSSPPPSPVTSLNAASASTPPVHHHVLAASHTSAPKVSPLVISAKNGECWLEVRLGGANGTVLFQGILEPGKTLTFKSHVWVRFGAPWNVSVHRGKSVPSGLDTTSPVDLSL